MAKSKGKTIRNGVWIHGGQKIVKDLDQGLVGPHPIDVHRHEIGQPHIHKAHAHTFYEMTCITGGRGSHTLDGKKSVLEPGVVYIIPPGVFHTVHIPSAMSWTNFLVKVEALPELFRGSEGMGSLLPLFYSPSPRGRLSATVFNLGAQDLERMGYLLQAYGAPKGPLPMAEVGPYRRHLVMAILTLWAGAHRKRGEAHGHKVEATILSLMTAVETLLDQGEDLSVKNLEGLAGVPLQILTSHFQKALGLGLASYLLRRKIQRSLWLLSQGQRMTFIADRLGFADGAHFSRSFKQVLGLSPREYLEAMPLG